MNTIIIISVAVIILILVGIFIWFYLFNIYETKILVHPKYLTTNIDSKIEIKVIPLNSFGRRALFRNIITRFELVSGESLVKITESVSDKIILQSLGQIGKVDILVTPEFGLFPSKIEIEIIPES